VGEQRWFCRGDQEWATLVERLKLMPCPHCNQVGNLNQHGCLYGFDEKHSRRKTLRGRRVFCSNRQRRRGCGRTFSVWCADKIRRLSLTTACLWRFLQLAAAGCLRAACRAADCQRSDRTLERLWQRFRLGQAQLRTALSTRCPPPQMPAPTARPAAQVLAHLQAAFPDADCPIAAFQHTLRTFFV
jgi:hypothetical protein